MCLIAVCDRRKMSHEEIKNAWDSNKDGAGLAYIHGRKQHVRKGFMSLDGFMAFYGSFDVLPHVVHFRSATSGGVSPAMTHPFACEVPPRLATRWSCAAPVLFHNGVLSGWQDVYASLIGVLLKKGKSAFKGPWNDTRTVALAVAACGEDVLQGLSGKFALLHKGRIRTYGGFTEDNGVLYSNWSYRSYHRTVGFTVYGDDWREKYVRKNSAHQVGASMFDSEDYFGW